MRIVVDKLFDLLKEIMKEHKNSKDKDGNEREIANKTEIIKELTE